MSHRAFDFSHVESDNLDLAYYILSNVIYGRFLKYSTTLELLDKMAKEGNIVFSAKIHHDFGETVLTFGK